MINKIKFDKYEIRTKLVMFQDNKITEKPHLGIRTLISASEHPTGGIVLYTVMYYDGIASYMLEQSRNDIIIKKTIRCNLWDQYELNEDTIHAAFMTGDFVDVFGITNTVRSIVYISMGTDIKSRFVNADVLPLLDFTYTNSSALQRFISWNVSRCMSSELAFKEISIDSPFEFVGTMYLKPVMVDEMVEIINDVAFSRDIGQTIDQSK